MNDQEALTVLRSATMSHRDMAHHEIERLGQEIDRLRRLQSDLIRKCEHMGAALALSENWGAGDNDPPGAPERVPAPPSPPSDSTPAELEKCDDCGRLGCHEGLCGTKPVPLGPPAGFGTIAGA